MESENEKIMLSTLEKNINSEFLINMLKRNWEKEYDIQFLSDLIGEVYNHHIINKDGYGFEYYMTQMESLYTQYKEHKISPENFELQRAKNISFIIASKLGIDIRKEPTEEDMLKVKNYFLKEYVENGYVSHSFPDAYYESIMTNGLLSYPDKRDDKSSEMQAIQDLFMSKGIVSPLGAYSYYGGSGIYYEHNFTNVFQHAIDSPEWFKWFTSSDHFNTYHRDISTSPYILRDEENCRRNVIDLCSNAGLSEEETTRVITFYSNNYQRFSSPKLNVGLISKKLLGKDDIEKVVPSGMNLSDTITYVLSDGARQYVDHHGNVYMGTILPSDIKVTNIPNASMFMYAKEYSRETKEQLTAPKANLNILKNAEMNHSRLIPKMAVKIKYARQVIEGKQKNFTARSEVEIQVANEIRKKNKIIAEQKQENKGKTLVKNSNFTTNSGFIHILFLMLIVGFLAGTIYAIMYMIIMQG